MELKQNNFPLNLNYNEKFVSEMSPNHNIDNSVFSLGQICIYMYDMILMG